jgi:hypothetical protein
MRRRPEHWCTWRDQTSGNAHESREDGYLEFPHVLIKACCRLADPRLEPQSQSAHETKQLATFQVEVIYTREDFRAM